MYNYRYRRFGWLPVLLLFFVLITIFSGGFHRPWFFFAPVFFCFPFLLAAGLAALFAGRWRYRDWPKYKNDDAFYSEKAKRDDSDIFYV
jgi:hypothetical protein